MNIIQNIAIGTQFIPSGKVKRVHTVIDIYVTKNIKGEIVKTEYLCQNDFMGQKINSLHCKVTIQRGYKSPITL